MLGLRIRSSKNCSPKEKKSFKLKLRETSHEVMVGNYYKSRVALQVTAREVMTFFLFGDQYHFGLHHTISGNRCSQKWRCLNNAWCAGVPRDLINWYDKKVWEPLIYSLACLNFFSTESGRYKMWPRTLNEFDTPGLRQQSIN